MGIAALGCVMDKFTSPVTAAPSAVDGLMLAASNQAILLTDGIPEFFTDPPPLPMREAE
tara:strand:- start:326 stop:502 length:177 start_codon:yes stop_codon:yes gene_type:complete